MKIDAENLYQLISACANDFENAEIEFKSAKGGFPGSFWETYSSFANTEGGLIVLGVKEDRKTGDFLLDGIDVKHANKLKKDFWSNVNNKNTVNINLLMEDDLIDIEANETHFLVFRIPMAERSQKPVHRGRDPYSGTYKRNYEGDYKCTVDEVQRMFADANINHPADQRILENYTLADIDKPSLDQFRRLVSVSKPNHVWLALDDIELLTRLGGYRKDRRTGKEGFTVAGLLMFGKYESITDTECAPYFFPDYRLYATNQPEGLERWIDRIYPDGTWEANLFQFYRLVLPKLTSALPKPFKLDEDTRIDETTAHVAIREALINLCIHADYSINASLVIKQFPNVIILSNPGTMLISRQQYYMGGESVCRNISLQKMFTMFGKAEKAGSGTDKIFQGWNDNNWRIPVLQIKSRPDKVELIMSQESIVPDETKEKLIQIFGENCLKWDHDKLIVLSLVCAEGEVSNESLQFVLPLHKTEITELLRRLKSEGILESHGYGRGTKYYIHRQFIERISDDQNHISSGENHISSGENHISSGENHISSGENHISSGENHITSDENHISSDKNHITSEQTNTTSDLKTDKKRRLSRKITEDKILEFCSAGFKSLSAIAEYLKKDINYLGRAYISPMVKDGKLRKLHPERRNHPMQQYINGRSIKS